MRGITALFVALALGATLPAAAHAAETPRALASAGVSQAEWDQVQAEVRRQAARARISERSLNAVAQRLGIVLAGRGRVDVSEILNEIEASATRIAELETRLSAYRRDDDPAILAAIDAARAAINAGDLDAAETSLAEARRLRGARNAARAAERQAQEDEDKRADVSIIASQAEVALLRYDHLRAAAFYAEAAAALPASDASGRWGYFLNQAVMLRTRGELFNEPDALREAVRVYEAEALQLAPKESLPTEWAITQNDLGIALRVLGVRGDDAMLARAVAAFEGALTVRTRERDSAGWAMTQMNLGNALFTLGERGDDAALARAVAAYENALTVMTRERDPAGWAVTQTNLGNALFTLGERGDDAALARAVAAYEGALTVRTRERDPAGWALTQMNLGGALTRLGERGDDAALPRAVAAYESALTVLTPDRDPAGWAVTQMNLGGARVAEGDRAQAQGGPARAFYEQALAALRGAADVFTPERAPAYARVIANNIAIAERKRAAATE